MFQIVLATVIKGFDVSVEQGLISQDSISCLKNERNLTFAYFEVKHHLNYTSSLLQNIANCKALGIEVKDFYFAPDISLDPREQVQELYNYFKSIGITHNFKLYVYINYFFDYFVETADNQWFFTEIMLAIDDIFGPNRTGFMANHRNWYLLLNTWSSGADKPLIWAMSDGMTNFMNWVDFGGWTSSDVVMKQYVAGSNFCKTVINENAIL